MTIGPLKPELLSDPSESDSGSNSGETTKQQDYQYGPNNMNSKKEDRKTTSNK